LLNSSKETSEWRWDAGWGTPWWWGPPTMWPPSWGWCAWWWLPTAGNAVVGFIAIATSYDWIDFLSFVFLFLFWKKKQLLRSALCNSCHLVIVLQQSCEIKEKLNEIQATNFTFFSMCSFVCLCTQFTLIIIWRDKQQLLFELERVLHWIELLSKPWSFTTSFLSVQTKDWEDDGTWKISNFKSFFRLQRNKQIMNLFLYTKQRSLKNMTLNLLSTTPQVNSTNWSESSRVCVFGWYVCVVGGKRLFYLSFFLFVCLSVCSCVSSICTRAMHLSARPAASPTAISREAKKNVSHRPKILNMVQPPMEASKAVRKLCWFERKKINR